MMLISYCVWGRIDLGRNIEVEDIGDAFTILTLYLIHFFMISGCMFKTLGNKPIYLLQKFFR